VCSINKVGIVVVRKNEQSIEWTRLNPQQAQRSRLIVIFVVGE
jgi:hypothetical protein